MQYIPKIGANINDLQQQQMIRYCHRDASLKDLLKWSFLGYLAYYLEKMVIHFKHSKRRNVLLWTGQLP